MRMREVLKPLPDDNILTVTCGNLVGSLHRDKFFCPGIHRECIEINGMFVTPKRFSVMGEKARLKDWKNAVRLNGFQLRKYIDSGILKFSNHESMCTGRCIARAPGARSGPAADTLLPPDSKPGLPRPLGMFTTLSGNNIMKIEKVRTDDQWSNGEMEEDVKPDVNQLQLQMLQAQNLSVSKANAYAQSSPSSRIAKTMVPHIYPTHITPAIPMVPPDEGTEDITEEDCEDRLLWKGIVELGLVDEFFREIKASLDVLKNGMIKRQVPLADSRKISVIVKQLGLMQKLKYKLEAHQTDMERQRQKLDREMEELQRKVREFEAKKALLKRKSECFEQLLDITAPKTESVWGEGSGSPSEYRSPSTYKRAGISQTENEPGQLSVVFPPQQMSSVLNTDITNMSANTVLAEESATEDSGTHFIVNINESATSANSYPEDLSKSASQSAVPSNTDTAMDYIITSAEDLSKSAISGESAEAANGESEKTKYAVMKEPSTDVQGDGDPNDEAKFTGIKLKVRRGRKRKPREIPRTDPSEEYVIKMEQAMTEEGETALNCVTGSNDSVCDYSNDYEEGNSTDIAKDIEPEKSGNIEGKTDPGSQEEDTSTLHEEQKISEGDGEDLTNGTSVRQDNEQITQSPCKISFDFTGIKVSRRGRKRKSREYTTEESERLVTS
ncbi:uncharacterized protein LOC132555968 [Ylistrum balloti]|uniref:uncharacterized protein LOC132555968 n=1 Tax=Ylistrum balloti TaxID=509963 RepID=UPI002905E4B4|nr:uncharacterized protein LOC132555968 [Ylistrum balloti]